MQVRVRRPGRPGARAPSHQLRLAGDAGVLRGDRPAEYAAPPLRKLQQVQVRDVHEGAGPGLRAQGSAVPGALSRGGRHARQVRRRCVAQSSQCTLYIWFLLIGLGSRGSARDTFRR